MPVSRTKYSASSGTYKLFVGVGLDKIGRIDAAKARLDRDAELARVMDDFARGDDILSTASRTRRHDGREASADSRLYHLEVARVVEVQDEDSDFCFLAAHRIVSEWPGSIW